MQAVSEVLGVATALSVRGLMAAGRAGAVSYRLIVFRPRQGPLVARPVSPVSTQRSKRKE